MFNNGFGLYPSVAKQGLFAALKSRFNWSTILTNTQKTLNIVNQAIPLVYQVRPIIDNAKTVFKIMGAVRDDSAPSSAPISPSIDSRITNNVTSNSISPQNVKSNINSTNNNPVFFL